MGQVLREERRGSRRIIGNEARDSMRSETNLRKIRGRVVREVRGDRRGEGVGVNDVREIGEKGIEGK